MLKQIFYKIDDKRETFEDFIATYILQKWDNYSKADDLRYMANLAIVNLICTYAESQGIPAEQVPQEVKERIAKSGVKVEKKLNGLLQKQLIKKNKGYKKRHV